MYNIVWSDRYNLGVDVIDKAHKQLFTIMRKMFHIIEETSNISHSCDAGIKYLKNYALKHFAEEEAYMKLIKYNNYERHKKIHDDMCNITIPSLEKELKETNYSDEAVHHFFGVCLGWLTGHIMIEDRCITGKINDTPINLKEIDTKLLNTNDAYKNKTIDKKRELQLAALEKLISHIVYELFALKTTTANRSYSGEYFGKSIYYRLIYSNKKGEQIKILMILEEKIVLKTAGKIMNIDFDKIDTSVISATKELAQQFIGYIGKYSNPNSSEMEKFKLKRESLITSKNSAEIFSTNYFDFSLLFNTEAGSFAFCVKKL